MLTTVQAGPYTIRGLSLGGIYTALSIPELHLALDAGIPARSFAGVRRLLLSHGHVDHAGALPALLGIRALVGKKRPLQVLMPAPIVEPMEQLLKVAATMQRYDLDIDAVGMNPGQSHALTKDLHVRAVRTYHPVPSLGYVVSRRVAKLRAEFHGLTGPEIAARRRAGEDLLESREHVELAYATDTLVDVLDREPTLMRARVLILECTFLDDRKPVATARAGCHIHLDELIERADRFENQHIVLMHFSQLYKPREVEDILRRRLPESLRERVIPLVPRTSSWPG